MEIVAAHTVPFFAILYCMFYRWRWWTVSQQKKNVQRFVQMRLPVLIGPTLHIAVTAGYGLQMLSGRSSEIWTMLGFFFFCNISSPWGLNWTSNQQIHQYTNRYNNALSLIIIENVLSNKNLPPAPPTQIQLKLEIIKYYDGTFT